MTDNPKDINQRLDELKRAYVNGLGAKIEEVEAAARAAGDAGAAGANPLSGQGLEALGALKQLVHKLAGSGGTFGFAKISDAAEKAETACEAMLETPSVDFWRSIEGHLDKLRGAVKDARGGG
ncbi:MAG: Hpt domain-containing protein [Proteobacteria bacterium]|nr:Hpt domain-containing protein [Pseudomonadota bacterium]